jgi:hypothetical protein
MTCALTARHLEADRFMLAIHKTIRSTCHCIFAPFIADALRDVATGDLMIWRMAGDSWDKADDMLAQHDSAVVTGSEVVAQDMDEIR